MGADMIATWIWARDDSQPNLDIMLKDISEYLSDNRADRELLEQVTWYTLGEEKAPNNPLYLELLLSDDEYYASWLTEVLENYRIRGQGIITSFNSRETTCIRLPGIFGYLTGGLSFGDSPTETFWLWSDFFYDDEEGNPLGDVCYKGMGFLDSKLVKNSTSDVVIEFS